MLFFCRHWHHWRELGTSRFSLSARCVWTSPRVWSRWPCGLGLAMFPRFYPHRFAVRWSHFTLFILPPLLHMLCPVRALKIYVDRSSLWRKSLQLLVCFGAGRRGLAKSKHRFSLLVRDAILLAYEMRGLSSPLSVGAHSTKSVPSSQAPFRGVP